MSNDQREPKSVGSLIPKPLFRVGWTAAIALKIACWVRNVSPGASRKWLLVCLLATAISIVEAPVYAQAASPPLSASSTSPAPAPPEAAAPAPIPLIDVVAFAESASQRVRDIQAELLVDRVAEEVAEQLPAVTREIDARLRESRNIVSQRPSVEMLDLLEAGWWRIGRTLYGWTWELTRRATKLEEQIADLGELEKKWQKTMEAGRNTDAPGEIVRRIEAVIAETGNARAAIERRRARILTVTNRVAAQEARIADALRSISDAREDVLKRLFIKDSGAIWSPELRSGKWDDLLNESRNSFATQWAGLRVYFERETVRFLIHVALFIILLAAFFWARRMRRLGLKEETDRRECVVLETPIAAALVLSVLCSWWIYPEAPRLLSAALIVLALISSVIILRRLIERDLYPIIYALVVFYLIHQVRALTAAVELLPRLLFLGEMIGAMLFLIWFTRAWRRPSPYVPETARLRRTITVAASVALVLFGVALLANILGYVTLANLVGNALLGSAYLALILYAVVEVLDGLFAIALGMRPAALLSTVNRHQPLLRRRLRRTLQWGAVFLWFLDLLDRLLLRDRLIRDFREITAAELAVGSLRVSFGDILAFVFTVWAAFLLSRFVRFLLDEEIYPRVRLRHGLPYAISTLLHYVILLVGFFAAVATLGLDMTRVTILAGAFSVGVGFGLQNIFNNFISGLILLFERPVNVGDVVQIEDASGVVERIGIRASIIRTTNGSEVIVPNGKLISERLINWTLSNRQHGIELPIAVAHGTDPKKVIEVLERTAAAHPLITGDPPPQALVVKLGPESVGFELRAWTDRSEQWMQIRSELAIAISAALETEKIAIR